MLVSHGHEFIYLKTRKTAGTSVEMALQPWCMPSDEIEVEERTHAIVGARGIVGRRMIPKENRRPDDHIWYNHMSAAEVHAQLGDRIWGRYRKLVVVRNPFDRMVSHFHWSTTLSRSYSKPQQGPLGRLGRLSAALTGGDAKAAAPVSASRDFSEVREAFRRHTLSRKWEDDAEIVHLNGSFCPDLVIRYETLAADMEAVAGALGLDPGRLRLPLTKNSKPLRQRRGIAEYYDDETIDCVTSRMAWVFDRFGYETRPVMEFS